MDGSKLQVNHKKSSGGKVTDYVGNMIYEEGSLKRILVDGGFYEEGKYYFYLRDYLGNNRVVADASGSAIQVIHYYPFGMSFAEGFEQDIKPAKQPYKYNGKELDGENSLNWYDYEARQLAMDVPRFTSIDPLAEKYYSWSPYAYVMNNPLRFIDPDGKKVVYAKGASKQFKKHFASAVQHLNKNSAGGLLKKLNDHESTVYIEEYKNKSSFDPKTMTIFWDPTMGMITENGSELSPTSILNHEVDHAQQELYNPEQKKIDKAKKDRDYENKEEKRVITNSEQETAIKLGEIEKGEVTRTNHKGHGYETTGPTTTEAKYKVIVTAPKKEKR